MKRFYQVLFVFVGLLAFTLAASSGIYAKEIRITQARLTANKINAIKFGIMNISGDGRVVTGYEKVNDPKIKQKGTVYKVWIFEFKGDSRDDVKITGVLIPCIDLQNAALSPDGKTCLITAERGSKFIKLDIPTKKVTVLFQHKKGTPGFRCDAGVIQYYNNTNVGAVGYFYDKKDVLVKKAIALIDYTKMGADMFKTGFDTTLFDRFFGKAKYTEWVDQDQCFFVGRFKETPEKEGLAYFNKGTVKIIDTAPIYKFLASGKNRVIYSSVVSGKVNDKTEKTEVFVRDVREEKPMKVTPDNREYSYLAMAKSGNAAIISNMNIKAGTISYYYGNEAGGWKMKPIPEQQNAPISQLRLSYSGNAYVSWDGKQIVWNNQLP